MSQIDRIVDELELYTVGRPKDMLVELTVEQLQSNIDKIKDLRHMTKTTCDCRLLLGYTYIKYGCCDRVDDYNSEIKYCKYCGRSIKCIMEG